MYNCIAPYSFGDASSTQSSGCQHQRSRVGGVQNSGPFGSYFLGACSTKVRGREAKHGESLDIFHLVNVGLDLIELSLDYPKYLTWSMP